MPIFKCLDCHHEWEGSRTVCDWCGSNGRILKEKSEFEQMLKEFMPDLPVRRKLPIIPGSEKSKK